MLLAKCIVFWAKRHLQYLSSTECTGQLNQASHKHNAFALHPHTPWVATADYVCTSNQYLWQIPLQNNEIAHQVMWYKFGWFQPHDAHVTCNVWDVEADFRIRQKNLQLLVWFRRTCHTQEFLETTYPFSNWWGYLCSSTGSSCNWQIK